MAFQYLNVTLINCTLNTRKVSIQLHVCFPERCITKQMHVSVCVRVCIQMYHDYQSENCTDVSLRHFLSPMTGGKSYKSREVKEGE